MLAVVSNIIVITDFVNLQHTCLPEAIYSICTPDDGWNCHPKRVKSKAIAKNKRNCCILLDLFHYKA